MLSPVDLADAVIHILRAFSRETIHYHEHAVSQPRPQTNAVGQFHIALDLDTGNGFTGRISAQSEHFVTQQPLHAFRTGNKKFKGLAHVFDFRKWMTFIFQRQLNSGRGMPIRSLEEAPPLGYNKV